MILQAMPARRLCFLDWRSTMRRWRPRSSNAREEALFLDVTTGYASEEALYSRPAQLYEAATPARRLSFPRRAWWVATNASEEASCPRYKPRSQRLREGFVFSTSTRRQRLREGFVFSTDGFQVSQRREGLSARALLATPSNSSTLRSWAAHSRATISNSALVSARCRSSLAISSK
jgi:hypothetical protein